MIELVLFILIVFVLLITSVIVIYNFITAPVVGGEIRDLNSAPLVSIMIPVRDEQHNIAHCIESILEQHYYNFEVIILDDDSKDLTTEVVKPYIERNQKISLISGKKLPQKWLGKNWACQQLADNAKGDVFLFIDADVRLGASCLNNLLFQMQRRKVKMISVFPTQLMSSLGEWLTVPLVNWMLITFLPIIRVFSSRKVILSAASGQLLLFDKNVYNEIGGHKVIKSEIAVDAEFAKLIKQKGMKVLTMLGGNSVFSKMYRNFDDAFNGFSKNFFPAFKLSVYLFTLLLFFFFLAWLFPVVYSFFNFLFIIPVMLILLQRIVVAMLSNQNILSVILHPFQMLVLIMIGVNSMYISRTGKIKWKGRSIN